MFRILDPDKHVWASGGIDLDEVFEDEGEEGFEPDFDASSSCWGSYLMFQRPARLSDEEMHWHFGDRDGRWSRQTVAALRRSGAKGLDLNRNWALTGQLWSCAGCGRSKEECFRVSKKGILLAKLELHHDHMRDLVWPRAGELLGEDWRDRIPGTGEILGLVRELTSRFSEAMICSECNAADGRAKKLLPAIDRRFTFTVSEIRQFVIPKAGADHGIDADKARAIWEAQCSGFEMRLGLLDMLVLEIGAGRLAHDRAGWPGIVPMQEQLGSQQTVWKAFHEQVRGDDRRSELSGLQADFLTRSVSLDSQRLAGPRAVVPILVPSDDQYATYSDPVSPKTWVAAPEDWACACCGRGKRDIVRMGKKGKWSGGVRKLRVLVSEADPETIARRKRLFPGYRNEFWVGDSYSAEVCSDCADVSRDALQRDRSAPEGYLSLENIREALEEVQAHAGHVVDYALVRARMRENQPSDSAYDAYSAFCSLVSKLARCMDFRMKRGIRREAVITEFCEVLQYEHGVDSAEERAELVEWLLTQKLRDLREE